MTMRGRPRLPENVEFLAIVTRKEAKAAGLPHYFTGVSCVHGHVARRFVTNSQCMFCARTDARESKFRADTEEFLRYRRRNMAANPISELLRRARDRAKRKNILFSLTHADVSMPESCPCCGCVMNIDTERRGSGNPYLHGPTLDRFDSSLGYVPGNVNVICWQCNDIKRSATADQLRTVARWMDEMARQRLKLVS